MHKKAGFTLLELMVVIGIILFLARLAIPKYTAYYQKARQAEVAINLSALYTAEQSYHITHGHYTSDLQKLAWQPQQTPYYTYGFYTPSATADQHYIIGTNKCPAEKLGTCHANEQSFLCRAAAHNGTQVDCWYIDQTGVISQEKPIT